MRRRDAWARFGHNRDRGRGADARAARPTNDRRCPGSLAVAATDGHTERHRLASDAAHGRAHASGGSGHTDTAIDTRCPLSGADGPD